MNRREFSRSMTGAALGAAALSLSTPLSASTSAARAESEATLPFRFSATFWNFFTDLPHEARLEKIAEAGYNGTELSSEFLHWSAEDYRNMNRKKRAVNLEFDAIGGLSFDPATGEVDPVGINDPAGMQRFLARLESLTPILDRLESRIMMTGSGDVVPGLSRTAQHDACIETLKRAGDLLAKSNHVLAVENIDLEESPRCYLTSVAEAIEIVRAVDNPHVKVLDDFFHEQVAEGNLIAKLEKNIGCIGLFHIADVPTRREPGTGEINYANIFRKLAELKYPGFVAMEYHPSGDHVQTLRGTREMALRAVNG